HHLAYVIYTSGSTGRPKGIGITQASLAEHSQVAVGYFGLTATDRMLQFSTINFDGFVEQLFPPLVAGAAVVLRGPALWDSETFYRELIAQRISIADLPTAYWHLLAQDFAHRGARDYGVLRQVQATGEAMPPEGVRAWREAGLGHVKLINSYGPTETVVTAIVQDCRAWLEDGSRPLPAQMPIGLPLAGREAYVLDADLGLAPAGVAGELYIGGALLARGYHGRAVLSAERFIADPFGDRGGRLYRTGDIARWNADGRLEYLGRADHQVKLRGFRVELAEIEAQLLQQPGVREAVVTAHDAAGGMRLVGYVSRAAGQAVDGAQIRAALAEALPEYMVPALIMVLDALPQNANGKIERKALPQPGFEGVEAFEAPQGAVEERLAVIWVELLGAPRIGRRDNFFALGGHSLLAIQLLERMRREGWTVEVRTLFKHPQLAALAAAAAGSPVRQAGAIDLSASGIPEDSIRIEPGMLSLVELDAGEIRRIEQSVPGGAPNIQDIYPLAPLQEGILFHHLMQAEGDAYVTPCLLAFDSRERLERFVAHLNRVIARHDILRTAVLYEGLREPVQVVCCDAALQLEWMPQAVQAGEDTDVAAQLYAQIDPTRCRIDITRAPLMRAVAAHDADARRWLLQLPSHHLVLDHTTQDLLVAEIALMAQGRERELRPPVPFRRFVAQARQGVAPSEHEAFFRSMLGDVDEPTAPFDLVDVHGDGRTVVETAMSVDAALSAEVRRQARRHGVSAATLFHLAWALVLARMSNRDDVVFGTVTFGRMQGGEDADRAFGMFMNTLPLRIRLGATTVGAGVQQTHGLLAELMHHEHASLALALRQSALPSGTPLFNALLNYRYGAQHVWDSSTPAGLEGVQVLSAEERTNYPITLSVDDHPGHFGLAAQVDASVSGRRVCESLCAALRGIVEALAAEPDKRIGDIDILNPGERAELVGWGVNETRYPDAQPVHRLIEQQVRKSPDATALVFGD
ncbi:condensation domain-containing protein, partial [Variovorax sp. MHTC-1]|uniref:condensation domain-containing protein n=1 Tax=Variovorax sp. MHTC-1 TaxID=2495593 RepID=UPI000F99009B